MPDLQESPPPVESGVAALPVEAGVAAFEPGVFDDMPGEQYHQIEAMSSSGAKRMLQSPAHFRLFRTKQTTPTAAMQFGTALHCGVLEPQHFDERVVCAPTVNKYTKAGKQEFAEFMALHAGHVVLSAEDMDRVRRCIDAIWAHPSASALLQDGIRERSLFWRDARFDVPCKARLDSTSLGGVVDVKSTTDASPDGFGRQCANLLYHCQAAHYWSGAEHALHTSPEFFVFVAVESEPPHTVACYEVPPPVIAMGGLLMDEALSRYQAALESNAWAGYGDTIQELKMPRWSMRHPM